jgi:hypothetical protein
LAQVERPTPTAHAVTFNLRQIAIVVWTLGAITVLGIRCTKGFSVHRTCKCAVIDRRRTRLQWFTDRQRRAALPRMRITKRTA